MTKDTCVWCWRLINRPASFDETKHLLVCNETCMKNEQAFRIHFSDSNIGERNMRDFGVNPNNRGKRK